MISQTSIYYLLLLISKMVKQVILFLLFPFLSVLQNTFFVHFGKTTGVPNFVLVFFIVILFFDKRISKSYFLYPMAFFAGLSLDLYSPLFFGVYTLLFIVLAEVLKRISVLIAKKNFITFAFSLIVNIFLFELSESFIFSIFAEQYVPFELSRFIYNCLLGFLFYLCYVFIQKTVSNKKKRR